MADYFLLDLERTIQSGVPAYWKGNKHGYTYNIQFAGIFSEEIANEIVRHDLDNATVKVPVRLVIEVLGKDLKANENC
jgi:hypothetical protein